LSTRFKILSGLIVIIFTSYFTLAFLTTKYVNKIFFKEVQTRVRLDLNSAHDIYNAYIERVDQILQAISIRRSIEKPLSEEIKGDMGKVLTNIYERSGIDMLTLIDLNGNVIFRAHNPDKCGDNISEIPLIQKVKQTWSSCKGTVIIDENILKREGNDLQQRSIIQIKKTQKSLDTPKDIEKRGMVIAAATPFISLNENKIIGILFGGYLINNNNEIVDEIKSRVYQDQKHEGKDIGTATIFFDDVRIATNVMQSDNTRAIGSRLSSEVYNKVIVKSGIWADRAFVVNDWYITAYEPIYNLEGNTIGALYVGLLEEPYKQPQKIIIIFFLLTLSITAFASLILMFFYTKIMMRPVDQIVKMSKKIMNGNLTARCSIRPSGEMGMLCKTIDQMADAFEEHEKRIQRETQMQIGQSEKLASIGRLAAGIAHEINNPLTGVLSFAHLLKNKKTNDEQDIKDIDVIIHETTRVRDIVRGLLDFARQSAPNKEFVNINEIIHQLINLIKNQKEFKKITISENFDKNLPELLADKNLLQQVFLNLILNAAEAITDKGYITISTILTDQKVTISVRDTGCGIKKDDLNKIFDPFYTTKPVGKGTGLGLSVSYGIVQQHEGTIQVESEEEKGTTFTVILPVKTEITEL